MAGTRVSYIKESREEIAREIERKVKEDPTVQIRTKKFAIMVRDHWRTIATEAFEDETGRYVESVHIERKFERAFKRLPQYWVGTRLFYAHFIEYGTGPDTKGSSPRHLSSAQRRGRIPLTVTRDTPTPEFALGAKTAHYFGGTSDSESYERL